MKHCPIAVVLVGTCVSLSALPKVLAIAQSQNPLDIPALSASAESGRTVALMSNPRSALELLETEPLQTLAVAGHTNRKGTTFQGTIAITQFVFSRAQQRLLINGVLVGTITWSDGFTQPIKQPLVSIPVELDRLSHQSSHAAPSFLPLDIGTISLSSPDLTIDLSPGA